MLPSSPYFMVQRPAQLESAWSSMVDNKRIQTSVAGRVLMRSDDKRARPQSQLDTLVLTPYLSNRSQLAQAALGCHLLKEITETD